MKARRLPGLISVLRAARASAGYLLQATFDASDQGYANAQVLDTVAEGLEAGSLTVVETDGTIELLSNRCKLSGKTAWDWNRLGAYSTARTRGLGLALLALVEFNGATMNSMIGWHTSAALPATDGVAEYWIHFAVTTTLSVQDPSPSSRDVATYAAATEYKIALVLGGHDLNGVPWYSGAVGTFTYGAAYYIKGGAFSTWTLLWRSAVSNTATLYPAYLLRRAGGAVAYIDDFRVPDRDYSAVLQPTCLSTFDAANGTSLHGITPEVGGAWTEAEGDANIQSNRANAAGVIMCSTVDAGIADCIVDVVVNFATNSRGGIVGRYTDNYNMWHIQLRSVEDEIRIYETDDGVWVARASIAFAIASSTDYDVRGVFDGQVIDAFVDGGNKITYGTATFSETVTAHGIRGYVQGDTFDNFAIYSRTSSTYDSELDASP